MKSGKPPKGILIRLIMNGIMIWKNMSGCQSKYKKTAKKVMHLSLSKSRAKVVKARLYF